ncbi:MAG: hypothetical protein J6X61_03980, partial [Clostridia bacterium]|nr:hypothetical protein [Clostridia bacterium]
MLYATNTSTHLKEAVDKYLNDTVLAAQLLAGGSYDSEHAFAAELRNLGRDEKFKIANSARFFHNGVEYTMGGSTYSTSLEAASVLQFAKEKRSACAGYVIDKQYNVNAVAFVTPIENCAYADVLVMFYPFDVINEQIANIDEDYVSISDFTGLSSSNGELLSLIHRGENASVQQHSNVYLYLRDRI